MEILIVLIIFGSVFGIFYLFITTRNKERMLMIEKGFDPALFHKKVQRGPGPFTYWTLKIGMLAVGVAFGIIVGNSINPIREEIIASSVFFFAGLFLIINFFLERMIWKKDEK